MNPFILQLIKLSNKLSSIDVPLDKKYKILKAITELELSISDIKESGLGKAVKKCTKIPGKPGLQALKIVDEWTEMVLVSTETEEINNSEKYDNKPDSYESHFKLKNIQEKSSKFLDVKNVNKLESDIDDDDDDDDVRTNIVSQKKFKNDYDSFHIEKVENPKPDRPRHANKNINENNRLKKERCDSDISENTEEFLELKDKKRLHEENSKSHNPIYNYNHITKYPQNIDQSSKSNKYTESYSENLNKNEEIRRTKHDTLKVKNKKTDPSNFTFENFLKDSAMTKPLKISDKKRHSDLIKSDKEIKKIRMKSPEEFNYLSNDLSPLNPPVLDEDIDEHSIYNRSDFMYKDQLCNKTKNIRQEIKEDVDCTSKYETERKIWVPTRKIKHEEIEKDDEDIPMINGVPENVIAQYDYMKLMEFEGDNRKIMRKTECFWERLFFKVHKSHHKKDYEKWREAFLRVQNETDKKLKELSARVKRNNDEKISAINKAKFINCAPGKNNRRIIPMHR